MADNNDMANSTSNEEHRFVESFKEIARCCICLETISPKMVMCNSGHVVCEDCTKEVQTCPLCQERFSQVKPLILRQLVEALPPRCKNKSCNHILKKGDRNKIFCIFKSTSCKLCAWAGPAKDVLEHVKLRHKECLRDVENDIEISVGYIQFNSIFKKVFYTPLFAFGQLFWAESIYDRDKGFTINIEWVLSDKPTIPFQAFTADIVLQTLGFKIMLTFNLNFKFSSTLKFRSGVYISSCRLQNLIKVSNAEHTLLQFRAHIKKER